MATEAQKLIGISLAKIAQSRMNRGGISLHKNLLVATVLQKARFIFMEEAYGVAFVQSLPPAQPASVAEKENEPPEQEGAQKRAGKRRREAGDAAVAEPAPSPKRCPGEGAHRDDRCLVNGAERPDAIYSECDRLAADSGEEPMEVDRITSLVSVFSFGAGSEADAAGLPQLSRSVSTPDLCSAQAKELEALQPRPALAMLV